MDTMVEVFLQENEEFLNYSTKCPQLTNWQLLDQWKVIIPEQNAM